MYDDKLTVGFTKSLLPLMEMVLQDNIIPSREQVLDKTKVAYHIDDMYAPEIAAWGNEFYRELYASKTPDRLYDENRSMFEWLPRSGRYFTIPMLPLLATKEMLDKFETVINSKFYAEFGSNTAKKRWFDEIYPAEYSGDAWVENVGDWWYIMNPRENKPDSAEFSLKLKKSPLSIDGYLDHSGIVLIKEEENIKIHLSNLCTNTDIIWDGTFGDSDNFSVKDYFEKSYLVNPDLSKRRITKLVFNKIVSVSITAENIGYSCYTVDGKTIVEVMHNGTADLVVK
jgi:hypothetical protein